MTTIERITAKGYKITEGKPYNKFMNWLNIETPDGETKSLPLAKNRIFVGGEYIATGREIYCDWYGITENELSRRTDGISHENYLKQAQMGFIKKTYKTPVATTEPEFINCNAGVGVGVETADGWCFWQGDSYIGYDVCYHFNRKLTAEELAEFFKLGK